MTRIQSLVVAIAIILTGSLAASTTRAGSPEDDVKAAYAAWDSAFSKADPKAIAAFYAEDAVLLPASHEVFEGPAGVEKFFTGIFASGATGHKLDLIRAHGDGNLVFGAAKWSANGKDANGADQPWGGLATHIFERQADGSLKIKLHTFN
jgi:ketosteroid isomerase-like protein